MSCFFPTNSKQSEFYPEIFWRFMKQSLRIMTQNILVRQRKTNSLGETVLYHDNESCFWNLSLESVFFIFHNLGMSASLKKSLLLMLMSRYSFCNKNLVIYGNNNKECVRNSWMQHFLQLSTNPRSSIHSVVHTEVRWNFLWEIRKFKNKQKKKKTICII